MFAVLFETNPNPSEIAQYLEIAGILRPELALVDGFLENERFRRVDDAGALLSLSFWRDEKSLIRWRTQQIHHNAQSRGRAGVLSDYRLRVGQVLDAHESTTMRDDLTEDVAGRYVSLSIQTKPTSIQMQQDMHGALDFESITEPGKMLRLINWHSSESAQAWLAKQSMHTDARHFAIHIIRSYGLQDRHEAPVFHPPAPRQ